MFAAPFLPSPAGVSLRWLTAEDTCGGTLRGSSGLISSFDFPGGDSPGAGGGGGGGGGGAAGGLGSSGECKWTVLADPGDTISLVFTEFQMEEKSDYLEVEGSEPPSIWWVGAARRALQKIKWNVQTLLQSQRTKVCWTRIAQRNMQTITLNRCCIILFQDPHKCNLKLKEVHGFSWALANLPRRRPEISFNMFNKGSFFIQRMSDDLCLGQIRLIKWRYSNYVSCSQGAVGSFETLINRSKLPFMKNGKNTFASIIVGS